MISKPLPGAMLIRGHPANDGLQLFWLFNEGHGTVSRDLVSMKSAVLNNFALSGATSNWVGNQSGRGIHCDGTNDYINIGPTLQSFVEYNKPFTICIGFKFHTYASTSYHALMGHVATNGTTFDDIEIRFNPSDQIEFVFTQIPSVNVQDGYTFTSSALSLTTDRVYFVAATYDGMNTTTSGKVYFNGRNVYSSTTDNGTITGTMYASGRLLDKDVYVASRNWASDFFAPIVIDHFKAYNRVLSDDEIFGWTVDPYKGISNRPPILLA